MSKKKVDTKEIGLVMGLLFFKFFLKTEYLHYGYWINDLEVDISNLKKAQENYTNLLLENISEEVKTILDVGCGSGKVAEVLIEKGYKVEAVSPSSRLTEHAKKLLKNKVLIYEGMYEEVNITKTYDLVLFSESFQYIDMHQAFQNALKHLNAEGYILICDFFQTEAEGKSPLGGGHKYTEYQEVIKNYPVKLLKEEDITEHIAPTMQVVNDVTLDLIRPLWYLLLEAIEGKAPFLSKILKWWYRKKLDKLENKHFKGERNPENFKKYKSYRLILFQKENA